MLHRSSFKNFAVLSIASSNLRAKRSSTCNSYVIDYRKCGKVSMSDFLKTSCGQIVDKVTYTYLNWRWIKDINDIEDFKISIIVELNSDSVRKLNSVDYLVVFNGEITH